MNKAMFFLYFLSCFVLANDADAKASAPKSWGLSGVPIDKYRADAITCGREGANADISGSAAAREFIAAERARDRNLNMPLAGADQQREQAQLAQRLNPRKRLAELQQIQLDMVASCLKKLGYRQFRLTSEQARSLARLPAGSAARRAFLYGLASDPAVLRDQAVTPESKSD